MLSNLVNWTFLAGVVVAALTVAMILLAGRLRYRNYESRQFRPFDAFGITISTIGMTVMLVLVAIGLMYWLLPVIEDFLRALAGQS